MVVLYGKMVFMEIAFQNSCCLCSIRERKPDMLTAFVENGLEVSEAHTCEESLEDYFKRVTGGEGIA